MQSLKEERTIMGSCEAAKKPHVVCVPLPYQSHINAMLKLAKLLHFKGFYITFVNTEFNHQKILHSRGPDSLNNFSDFQFRTIPDGLPQSDINSAQDIYGLGHSIVNNFAAPFRCLISKLNQESVSSDFTQVTCIVSDALGRFAVEVADEFGIPVVVLWAMSAAYLMSNLHFGHLVENEILPIKKTENGDLPEGYLDMPFDSIPGMKDIRLKDLPSFFWEDEEPSDNVMIKLVQGVYKASAIIINTFDALEREVLEALKSLLPPVYAIGPLQLLLQEVCSKQLNYLGSNFWKEDVKCIEWLDSKEVNSVLYVNFGSLAVLTEEQFNEFAWGLANSKQLFLWVIRPGILTGNSAIFPPEFIEETADRGMISEWCPQEEVLRHSSTGGFLTHSGWNSTMDTICGGVPVLSWPQFADQQSNCTYACVHWGIGMEIDRNVKRDEVEALVRDLMEGEMGMKMRERAKEWQKNAEESTKPGGTSYENCNRILEVIVQKALD